jgi:hypothetical protein
MGQLLSGPERVRAQRGESLLLAASEGNLDRVKELLEEAKRGGDDIAEVCSGELLCTAVGIRNKKLVHHLLRCGAKPNARDQVCHDPCPKAYTV